MNNMYAMVPINPGEGILVGSIHFGSSYPWESYRLSSAIEVVRITGEDIHYRRLKFRMWANFYMLEPQWTSDIYEGRADHFRSQVAQGYNAIKIGVNKCIFKADVEQYVLGTTANTTRKIHALRLKERDMWNGGKYLAAHYLCSGAEMSGLSEVTRLRKGIVASLDTVKQHKDIITCSNCSRKLA